MGMLDDLKNKAAKLAADHPDKVEQISDQVIERAGDAADKATGGKHADKIDAAQRKTDEAGALAGWGYGVRAGSQPATR
jgi:hypothetical protein